MSAQSLFNALKAKNIIGSHGTVYFEMQNSKCVINDSSIVGNVIQSWLQDFMNKNNIQYRTVDNTQEFPDFYLSQDKNDVELLEVKCFTKSANFDVANFLSYCHSILEKPYRLNADYLIFEYSTSGNGIIIKNIWLKKVWEICGGSDRSAIKIQWKKGQAYNIRPSTWHGTKKVKYPAFSTRLDFIKGLQEVLNTHSSADSLRKDFVKKVSNLFKEQTGEDL